MCPRVPMERGTTWRWMFSVWLSVFCGIIVKESDLYSRKTAFGSDLYQLWDIWRFSPVCRISFPSGSLHSLRISWQIPPTPPQSLCLGPSEHLAGLCQGMNELDSRLSLKATAFVSANCRTCQHNHSKAFLLLESPPALAAAPALPDQQCCGN